MDKSEIRSDIQQIEAFVKPYIYSFKDHYESNLKNCVYWQYATRGEVFHRGFYCPTLVMDSVIGNYTRGRKVKKEPAKSPYFRYGFDESEKLLIVDYYDDFDTHEFLIYEQDREYGITFQQSEGITKASQCLFDDKHRLITYLYFDMFKSGRSTSYRKECYQYFDENLLVDCYDIFNYNIQHDKYNFSVKDGYLTQFTIEESEFNSIKSVKNINVYKLKKPVCI